MPVSVELASTGGSVCANTCGGTDKATREIIAQAANAFCATLPNPVRICFIRLKDKIYTADATRHLHKNLINFPAPYYLKLYACFMKAQLNQGLLKLVSFEYLKEPVSWPPLAGGLKRGD
jgi:hypothetical protein